MDFDFSEEQVMLRDVARQFLADKSTVEHARKMFEDALGYDKGIYRQMAEVGLLGLPFPESYGGAGMGMVEQAIVLEEMGRVAYPGPYTASVVLAGTAIMASGDEQAMARYLPGIASGEMTATLAFLENDINWGSGGVKLRATADGADYVLNGIKRFVPFAHAVDTIVVVARTGDGADDISLVAVPRETAGLTIQKNDTLDPNSKISTLTFENVRVPTDSLIGTVNGAAAAVQTTLQRAALGAAAEMLGSARKALEMSVDYAKVREQFGQPIGSFQAIKHYLATMLEATENTHSAVYYAAWAVEANSLDAALAVSSAKAYANESARMVTGQAIQVHGGIGYTWEYDLHLYWKRAKHLEPLYGDTAYHRERVLQEVFAGRVIE